MQETARHPGGVDAAPAPAVALHKAKAGGLALHSIVAPSAGSAERRQDANLGHLGSTGV